MEPTRIAIFDVSGRDRKTASSSELIERLRDDGFEVEDALAWPEGDIVRRLGEVESLLVICGPGVQSFLDESVWLRGMLEYAKRYADPSAGAGNDFVPVLLGNDPETFIPAFLSGLPFVRYPDGYDVLVKWVRTGRKPAPTKKGSSKRGPTKNKARPVQQQTVVSPAVEEPVQEAKSSPEVERPPGTRVVELVRDFKSGSLRKAQDDFSERYRSDDERLVLERGLIEPHIELALRAAAAIARSEDHPVDAATALRGVLFVCHHDGDRGSMAFKWLERLLGRAPHPTVESEGVLERRVTSMTFTEPLASSLEHALRNPSSDGPELWGRDFITAALLVRDDPSLAHLAATAGTTVPELQDRWHAAITNSDVHRSTGDWNRWWRHAGVPLPSERGVRAGVLAESTRGEDHIGIAADVEAFARLIADEQTSPPLSIGLIGDWGSGKSFFMERVHDRIEELEGTGPGLCQQVAHIRFSAWHYSDTNIWASLVGHIFDELWAQMVPQADDAQARAEVREQLKAAHGAVFEAESEVERARGTLQQAREREREALGALAIRQFVTQKTEDGLRTLAAEVGWSGSLESIVDLERARDELRSEASRTRSLVETALRGPVLRNGLLWIAGITLAAAALTLLGGWLVDQDWVRRTIRVLSLVGGTVGSLVAAVAAPLTKARRMIHSLGTAIGDAITEYESKVEAARATEEGQAIVARTEAARGELAQLRARAEAARERLAELERRRASLDPARRLTEFLQARASTEDYRARQGIISLVRRDFEQLSSLMRMWRAEGGTPPEGVTPVDRIVLYIDDLDRCSPHLVVRTLEAIHLLLALDLFVVVVAVDSRWLLRALTVHYEDLLGTRDDDAYRASTPQSYLEKIFQITFAVAPMTEDGYGRYVDYLTGRSGASEQAPSAEPRPAELVEAAAVEASEASEGEPAPLPETPEAEAPETEAVLAPAGDPAGDAPEPSPARAAQDVTRALSVTDAERRFLKQLHGLVATPRLVKRLVNVFRLVKSRVSPSSLADFEAEGHGRHRPILLLLALLYGRPERSLELFRALTEGALRSEDGDEDRPLHVALRDRIDDEIASWVQQVAPDITVSACEAEAHPLARYSLITGQHWHTWRRPAS